MKRILSLLTLATLTLTACGPSGNTPTFVLTASDATVRRAASTSGSVNVVPLNDFTGPVTLSVSGLPAGVTATFTPETITPNSGTNLVAVAFTATSAAPHGTYNVVYTGKSGGLTQTVTQKLTVDWADAEMPKLVMRYDGSTVEALVTSSDPVAKVDWYFQGEYKATSTTAPYTFKPVFTQYGTYQYVIKAVVTDSKGATVSGDISGQITRTK